MRNIGFAAALVLLSFAVDADAQTAPSALEQALQGKLQDELNLDMQVRILLAQAQAQIADLKKQLADKQPCKK